MLEHPKQHSREYQMLMDNIPGGVQKCLRDPFFTMVEVNQGFLDLVGYSRKELSELFQDRFIDIIYPADRQKVVDEVTTWLTKLGKCTFNYRVCCKGGGHKWVMDNCQLTYGDEGEEIIFCVLIDITDSRDMREELRLSMERYQIIMDQSADIIFDWDLKNDTMYYSGNWEKKFGYAPFYEGFEKQESAFRHIHPDDVDDLKEAIMSLKSGQSFAEAEARIQNVQGQYNWCRFRSTKQYDCDGQPLKVVGIITDIDKEKRMINDLRRRAERDALTGLYNREETERQICRYLEGKPEEICALYMIDTDNFKQINDSQGHYFGDTVLAELAAGMKRLTRQTDVVGRVGGDEFTIFLKNIPSREVAVNKAESLIHMFRSLFREERQKFGGSCSIGVSLYPDDGEDFASLYRRADLALYQAKSRGKNQYVLWESGFE